MKLYKRSFAVLALALGLTVSSCEDIIDLRPTDVIVTDIALENLADFQQALTGVYSGIASANYWGGAMIVVPARISDDTRRSIQNLGEGVQMHSFTYTADITEAAALWNSMYSVINRANIIINRIDGIEGTAAVKNQIKGEALAIRAMAHFDLVRVFAQRYDFTADASHLGVPYMEQSVISTPARNTVAEVYSKVNADLVAAKGLMTNTAGTPTRLTPLAVSALQARVALYQQNYNDAVTFATEAISGRQLATGTNFTSMWKQGNNVGEAIYKIALPTGTAQIGSQFYSVTNDLISFNPTQSLLNLYDRTNDIRFNAYYEIVANRPNEQEIVMKYTNRTNAVPGQSDVVVLRAAEMYLIRAEAYARTNRGDLALADLNALRAARITDFVPGSESGESLLEAIITEKRKELAFEGHRFFDLKRLNRAIVRTGNDCNTTNCTLPAGNGRFALPIPQAEVFANPSIVQNEIYVTQ